MDPFKIAFLIIFCFVGGIGYWSYVASYLRFSKSRSTWTRTTGRVEWFGLNYGKPAISYAYMPDGKTFKGSKFTPGPLVSNPKGAGTWFPKSTYLKTDRTLRFPPGGTVEVYYDPSNPSDAALLLEPPSAKGVLLVSLFLGLLFVGFLNSHWISQNKEIVIPLIVALFGLFFALLMGIRWVRRYLVSRRFPSTSGKLITAEVASSSGRNSTGYYIMLDVSYSVEGASYRTQQLGSLPFFALKSRIQDVQAQIDRLKADPDLRVYYEPAAPWDGFLNHVSMPAALAPILLGSMAACVGVVLLTHQLSRGHWGH